jgi:multidrug efflux system membrane fusion protein
MRRRPWVFAGAAALCAAGLITSRSYAILAPPAAAQDAPAPVPVVTAKVGVSDMPLVKIGLGTVTAYNTVDVHSQVVGTIQKIGFVEGQEVHPGSLIAQLDPRPFQAALQQAQATLARDQAHLANAHANCGGCAGQRYHRQRQRCDLQRTDPA